MNPVAPSRVLPSLLRQLNERRVLAALQRHGPLSRAEICRLTGISGPTVTRVVATLMDARLIEEEEPRQRTVGRPGKIVRLARSGVCVLGLVVGPANCESVAAGLDGELDAAVDVRTFATPKRYADLLSTCVRELRALMARRKGTVLGLAISIPGLMNRREGRSIVSPNLHQLDNHNLGADLQERLQIDCTVLQECHALCRAEQAYGEARGSDDFAMLDISSGLGLAVMQGGRIVQGHSGLAGELGHVTVELAGKPCGCGNRGCLETVATDSALAVSIGERLGESLDIEDVLRRTAAGRLDATVELDKTLEYLAVGVAAVINIFNPGKLFIYGRLFDLATDVFPRLVKLVEARALGPSFHDCQISRARGSKRLGVIAAAGHDATQGRGDAE
jgi:predicted NBD/HSP70 family sugar kinase